MEIRKPRIGDAKAGSEFINSLVAEGADIGTRRKFTVSRERKWLTGLLVDRDRFCLCAFGNNALVGSVEVKRNKDDVSRHVGEFGISVRKECRGTGVAHVLARSIFTVAKRNGITILRLRVFSTNKRAIRFYGNLGFKKIATLKGEIRLGKRCIDAYLMGRKL